MLYRIDLLDVEQSVNHRDAAALRAICATKFATKDQRRLLRLYDEVNQVRSTYRSSLLHHIKNNPLSRSIV